jgi:purine-binding chemotaxis protein CheW
MSSSDAASSFLGGQVVAFTVGGEEYALPIDQIREVIRYTQPRNLSSSDPQMLGVISLRGKIVPVADLGGYLGVNTTPGEDAKIVILDTGDAGSAGVIVDDVHEVLTLQGSDIEPLPNGNDSIAKIGDRLVVVLNARDIFGDTQLAA